MITLNTAKIWSEKEQAIVDWTISSETETDEGGNEHQVIVARYNDEFHRFSPNTTNEELLKQIEAINSEKA